VQNEAPESLPELLPFPYDSIPAAAIASSPGGSFSAWVSDDDAAKVAIREAQGRAQARQEAMAEARKNFDDQLARERASVAATLTQFHGERADYFRRVEAEVVQLALSIARKILHRETQLDPQLLAGIVRVALEKIEGATEIKLRVHPRQAAGWRQYLSMHMQQENLPELIEDAAQPIESCILQTSMGTAVLGVEVQLKEIEQGLADLLAARPGVAS
jgi:flagellar assembly protein FliH